MASRTPIKRRLSGRVLGIESTVFVHGLPRQPALDLAEELGALCAQRGVQLAIIGVMHGRPIVGLTPDELSLLIETQAPKLNTANLGVALHSGSHGATTVSTTIELAAEAGLRLIATGGLGGVHKGYAHRLDVSSDVLALARYPVGVVCSGVKSILDIASTREALETLGVPVIGVGTDVFPAFMVRGSAETVDGRIDDPSGLARFLQAELGRGGSAATRGVVIAQPVPAASAIDSAQMEAWLEELAQANLTQVTGRGQTPSLLEKLRQISGGQSLEANLALLRANVELGAAVVACFRS